MATFELPHLISVFFVGALLGAGICLKILGYFEGRSFRVGKFSADRESFQILVMLQQRGTPVFRLTIKEKFKGIHYEETVDSMLDHMIVQGLVDAVGKDRVELSRHGHFFIHVRRVYEGTGMMFEVILPSEEDHPQQEKGDQAS